MRLAGRAAGTLVLWSCATAAGTAGGRLQRPDRSARQLQDELDAAPDELRCAQLQSRGGREAVLHPPFHVDRNIPKSVAEARNRYVDLSQKRVVDLRDANPRAVMDINLNEVRPNGVRHNRQA